LWELAVKHSLGKLELELLNFEASVEFYLSDSRVELLPVRVPHIIEVNRLPHHHRDPFDRMLIAQAISDDLTLVSNDRKFAEYDCRILW